MEDDFNEPAEFTAELDEREFLLSAEMTNRYFATAYLLNVAGILNASTKAELDKISQEQGHRWDEDIERRNNIAVPFAQNLYATLLEYYLPHEAVAFMLRGLGYSYPEPLVEALITDEPGIM